MSLLYAPPSVSTELARQPHLRVVSESDTSSTSKALTGGKPLSPSLEGCTQDRLFRAFVRTLVDQLQTDKSKTVSQNLISTALGLVHAVLVDGGPTPQLSLASDGSMAVEWLVDRQFLTIHFNSPSHIYVWAEDASGSELFDYELNANWTQTSPAIVQARSLLEAMAQGVVRRSATYCK